MKLKNQSGFALVEALVILLVVVLIGGAAYYVGTRQNKDTKTTDTAKPAVVSKTNADPTANWKTYRDPSGNISFKYPSSWNLDTEVFYGSGGKDVGVTVTSPTGKVEIGYANFVAGLGGGSCPDDFPCPIIDILDLKDIKGTSGVKYVEKITYWKDNGDDYVAAFGIVNDDIVSALKVGRKQQSEFYMTNNLSGNGGYFDVGGLGGNKNLSTFKTYNEAKAFLDSSEAKTAKQIIQSLSK